MLEKEAKAAEDSIHQLMAAKTKQFKKRRQVFDALNKALAVRYFSTSVNAHQLLSVGRSGEPTCLPSNGVVMPVCVQVDRTNKEEDRKVAYQRA